MSDEAPVTAEEAERLRLQRESELRRRATLLSDDERVTDEELAAWKREEKERKKLLAARVSKCAPLLNAWGRDWLERVGLSPSATPDQVFSALALLLRSNQWPPYPPGRAVWASAIDSLVEDDVFWKDHCGDYDKADAVAARKMYRRRAAAFVLHYALPRGSVHAKARALDVSTAVFYSDVREAAGRYVELADIRQAGRLSGSNRPREVGGVTTSQRWETVRVMIAEAAAADAQNRKSRKEKKNADSC